MKKAKIIGAGISGATLANKLANSGWKVDLYEKKSFIGGNCFDLKVKGILIHKFGPHIFHTNNNEVYNFLIKFSKFNKYVNRVLVKTAGKVFPLPINFDSIKIIFGSKTKSIITTLKTKFPNKKTITFFELKKIKNNAVKQLSNWVAKNVYLNYSQKMWGTKFSEINPKTINRVKIFLSHEHNYFPEDKYQGLPVGGYTKMISKMLLHKNIKIHLNYDALKHIGWGKQAILWDEKEIKDSAVIYCGPLDEALDFKYGMLPYRSLNIKFEQKNKDYFQETGVVNYPSDPKMTRITEYKYLTNQKINCRTIISKEFPGQFRINSKEFNIRYYPIINNKNVNIYNKYFAFFKKYKNFYPLGRLAQYKYFDMDDAIDNALKLAKRLKND